MVRYLLTSSGLKHKGNRLLTIVARILGLATFADWQKVRVLWVRTPMHRWPERIQRMIRETYWAKEFLKNLGAEVVEIDLETATPEEVREELAKANVLYLDGGDPYLLLEAAERCELKQAILGCDHDLLVIGCSAGSIILGQTFKAIVDRATPGEIPDAWRGKVPAGLGLVPFDILPHADMALKQRLYAFWNMWHGLTGRPRRVSTVPVPICYQLEDGEAVLYAKSTEGTPGGTTFIHKHQCIVCP